MAGRTAPIGTRLAELHLRFYGVTAEGVAAILADVNHGDRDRVD